MDTQKRSSDLLLAMAKQRSNPSMISTESFNAMVQEWMKEAELLVKYMDDDGRLCMIEVGSDDVAVTNEVYKNLETLYAEFEVKMCNDETCLMLRRRLDAIFEESFAKGDMDKKICSTVVLSEHGNQMHMRFFYDSPTLTAK